MERDNYTKVQALKRINSQMPIKDKIRFADVLIDNSGSISDLEENLDSFGIITHKEEKGSNEAGNKD